MAVPCENPHEYAINFRRDRDAAAVWKFANLLHILPAAGTNSHVHLMRILAQHCAHGGAERVSPCHSSCTGPCTRLATTSA